MKHKSLTFYSVLALLLVLLLAPLDTAGAQYPTCDPDLGEALRVAVDEAKINIMLKPDDTQAQARYEAALADLTAYLEQCEVSLAESKPALAGFVAEVEPNDTLATAQNLDANPWTLDYDLWIGDLTTNTSTTIPHIEIYGTGDGTYDYYSLTVSAGARAVFDIDCGSACGGSFDPYLRLYTSDETLVASNDDANTSYGQGGSVSWWDSYLEYTFPAAGTYVLKVSRYPDSPIPPGADYYLMISLETTVVCNPGGNYNCYELVAAPGISWADAEAEAEARTNGPCPDPHLATITSAAEQGFISDAFGTALADMYLGGLQAPDAQEPAEGWQWVTGEVWSFESWNQGEPNDAYYAGYDEDYLQFSNNPPFWNDTIPVQWLPYRPTNGYLVEYECLPFLVADPNGPYSGDEGEEILFDGASSMATVVIDLEDLYPGHSAVGELPQGYADFTWSTQVGGLPMWITRDYHPGSGYEHGTIGNVSLITPYEYDISLGGRTFTFGGAYITAAWNSTEPVVVEGWLEGSLLYQTTITTHNDQAYWFDFGWQGVDTVWFRPQADPNPSAWGDHIAIDNLTVTANDIASYDWDFGDGSPIAYNAGPTPSHTYDDNGNYTVCLTVTDFQGMTDTQCTTAAIANVAPTATFNAPPEANEGQTFTLSLTDPDDPSPVDTGVGFTYSFDCGDGWFQWAGGSNSYTCTASNADSITVQGAIMDKDGDSTIYSAQVQINHRPTADPNGPYTGDEGSPVAFDGTGSSDPDGDLLTYDWDFGDGNTGTGDTPSHTYDDNGEYTACLTVTDPGGLSDTKCTGEAIVNAGFEAGDFSGWVTQDLTNSFYPLQVAGAGLSPGYGFFTSAPTEGSFAALHGFDGNGPGTIRIAQDVALPAGGTLLEFDYRAAWNLLNFGASQDRLFQVHIEPAGGGTPLQTTTVLVAQTGTTQLDTGNLTGSVDVSSFAGSIVRISFDWVVPESYTGPAFFQLDNVRLLGGGGGVTILNVAPTATFNAPIEVDEGDDIVLSLTDPQDPSPVDTFEYSFDCGDGSGFGAWSSSNTATCPTDDNGVRVVRGRIKDDDMTGLALAVQPGEAVIELQGDKPVPPTLATVGPIDYIDFAGVLQNTPFTPGDGVQGETDWRQFGDPANWEYYLLEGSAGDQVIIEVHRTTSAMDPAMQLCFGTAADTMGISYGNCGPAMTFVARADDNNGIPHGVGGSWADPRIAVTLPEDGAYTLMVFDYAGAGPGPTVPFEVHVSGLTPSIVVYEALVTINNVAPTGTFNAPTYVVAGDDFDLSLTNPYDPSPVDTAAGFAYDFDCGDGYDGWGMTDYPWTGSGSGTTTVVSDGSSEPAQFTYDYPGPNYSGGSWEFKTVAASAGTHSLDWVFSGFHSWFMVTVSLEAFVDDGTTITTINLVDDGPQNCCDPPSGGFTYSGTHTFSVQPGDVYGFRMAGSHFDWANQMYGAFTVAESNATCSTPADKVGDSTVKGKIRDKDGGETEYTATVTILPPSAATDSNLCYYDREPKIDGQQFRLIFTPDVQLWPACKLPGSNPGQFFYNVFYTGAGPASFDITVPQPFETQEAMPVRVYTDVSVIEIGGFKCFVPDLDSEIYAGDFSGLSGLSDPGGFLYVTVRLDYGDKGTTGYIPNLNNDALDAADEATVLIPNLGDYAFSVSGSQNDSQTIHNVNEFKKNPGFGGLVTDGVGDPVAGATVDITLDGALLGTATTDDDGWYLLVYMHTGNPADYTVTLPDYGLSESGTLKADQFAEENFVVP